ncbi:hypothetical protein CSUB01_03949 [Colletotrichum sublineola]|uniref:Uncharacterized protein n=1 Tax=Colletotrichum sublineola TaxID=1173701 RepID=A0A066XHE5_COLSU|nr:hypothetical protein CSUB01_03949 [Colletotrichum sublineola]
MAGSEWLVVSSTFVRGSGTIIVGTLAATLIGAVLKPRMCPTLFNSTISPARQVSNEAVVANVLELTVREDVQAMVQVISDSVVALFYQILNTN